MPMSANPAGNAFCGKCGKPFVSVCPKCGAKLADGQRFCGACGFGAVAAIIALLAAPLANAVIKSETGFDIKALSAEAPRGCCLCSVYWRLCSKNLSLINSRRKPRAENNIIRPCGSSHGRIVFISAFSAPY